MRTWNGRYNVSHQSLEIVLPKIFQKYHLKEESLIMLPKKKSKGNTSSSGKVRNSKNRNRYTWQYHGAYHELFQSAIRHTFLEAACNARHI